MGKLVPFLLLIAAYLVFEFFTLQKTKHRFDPVYILDQYLLSHYAVMDCGDPEGEQWRQFQRNLQAVKARAAKELRERYPEKSVEAINQMIDRRSSLRELEVSVIRKEQGCAGGELQTLLKRFEIQARLRAG